MTLASKGIYMAERLGRYLITGSTRGLGLEIARHFVDMGADHVVICGRDSERGQSNAKALGAAVTYVQCDLSTVNGCRTLFDLSLRALGRLDGLINVAGITDRGTILSTTPELFEAMIGINLRAPFFLMQSAIREFVARDTEGTIVNIGSIASQGGQPYKAAYCASKGGLDTLTRNTAFAVLRNSIRVNGISVGWMATEGEDRIQRRYHQAKEGWAQRLSETLPAGRFVDPQEVARLARYLSTAESGLMTGSVIALDQSVIGAFDFPPRPRSPMTLDDSETAGCFPLE